MSRYSVNTTTRSFVQCLPSGRQTALQVGDQLAGLGVGRASCGGAHSSICRSRRDLAVASVGASVCSGIGAVAARRPRSRRSSSSSRVSVVVEELVEPLGVVVVAPAARCRPAPRQGLQVDADGVREGGRAGEQPLLEQQRDQVDRLAAAARLVRRPGAGSANSASSAWTARSLVGVVDRRSRRCAAAANRGVPSALTMSRLSRRTTVCLTRAAVRVDAAGEALVVEDLQQRGERRLVAVVRGRGQEQPVREVRREPADQLGLLRVDGVDLLAARPGRRGAPRRRSAGRTCALRRLGRRPAAPRRAAAAPSGRAATAG